MASSHDIGATPRPIYKADGRKLPDCYTVPAEVRDELDRRRSARFRCSSSGARRLDRRRRAGSPTPRMLVGERAPTLTLAYLPHLDYDLQRFGPDDPRHRGSLTEIDAVAGDLSPTRRRDGARVIVLSGIRHHRRRPPGPHQPRAARGRPAHGARGGRRRAARRAASPPSRSPTIRSRTSTSPRRERTPEVRALLEALPGVERVSTATARVRSRSIIRAPANWSRSRAPTPGSPTITGTTIVARRTSRARSRSIASPATTRSSCSSIPPSGARSSRSAARSRRKRSASAP